MRISTGIRRLPISLLALALTAGAVCGQQATTRDRQGLREALQHRLVELHSESGAPGVVAGVVLPDGTSWGFAAGSSDTVLGIRMKPSDRLLQGSVGKTYVAAIAMQLVHEGRLELDAKVSEYLGEEDWYIHLPNHEDVTVGQLMNHTSGIIRYEFNERFIDDLLAQPAKVWDRVEQLAYLFDTEAPFAAGEGWDYSDSNYIVMGMIIERLTGSSYYDELRGRILGPLDLENTVPSDSRRIPGLVQGYSGVENPFRLPDAMIVDGEFAINPQLEWTGGGVASSAEDLARWAEALYEGRAFDESMLPIMLDAVPARLGPDTEYGLGVIIRPTPLGTSWGHSGFFQGYLTEMAYFPDHGIAVAVMVNSSDFQKLRVRPGSMLMELAQVIVGR